MSDDVAVPFAERAHHKMIHPDQKIHEMVNENERLRAELAASAEALERAASEFGVGCRLLVAIPIIKALRENQAIYATAAKRAREAGR